MKKVFFFILIIWSLVTGTIYTINGIYDPVNGDTVRRDDYLFIAKNNPGIYEYPPTSPSTNWFYTYIMSYSDYLDSINNNDNDNEKAIEAFQSGLLIALLFGAAGYTVSTVVNLVKKL